MSCFVAMNANPLTGNIWKHLSVMPLPLRRSIVWSLTRFAPESLSRMAIYTSLAHRWANVGDKLHKGAGVILADSVGQLYKRMATHWSHLEQEVLEGPSRVPCVMGWRPRWCA